MDLRNAIGRSLKPFSNGQEYQPETRRKYPRVLMDLPFEYWTRDNPHARRGGIALNASETGFLIHSIENMCIGTQLNIALFYIWGYALANLEVSAEIIWKDVDKTGRYLYGLKFVGILKEDSYKLRALLARTFQQPPAPMRPSPADLYRKSWKLGQPVRLFPWNNGQ